MRFVRTASKVALTAALFMSASALDMDHNSDSRDLASSTSSSSLSSSSRGLQDMSGVAALRFTGNHRVLVDNKSWLMAPLGMAQLPDSSVTFTAQINFITGSKLVYYFEYR